MFEGQVFKTEFNGNDRLVVDAEPYVMAKIRKIFDNANTFYNQGKYTHKPIIFPINLSACRDIVWIMERYKLEVSEDLLSELTGKAKKFDDLINFVSKADQDGEYKVSPNALPLALPLREHQVKFNNMFKQVKFMLLADKMGLGKTPSGISTLQEPEARPALIVVPPTLCSQWDREVKRFLPGVTTHVIRGFKNYDLPVTDVLITSYNRLAPWQDVLISQERVFKTVIFDEIQELRHTGTGKRETSKQIALRSSNVLGMSGTPIYNYGEEIWSVMDVIKDECLGSLDDFKSEWCDWGGRVREPMVLNSFMKKQGLMLRRTPEDCGMQFGEASKHVYTIDADIEKLKEVQNVAKLLALSVLSGNVGEDSEASREFDWKLRHATGVAKARPVAEFVKMLLEEKDKIVLVGWHRDVYDIWQNEFKAYKTVMYTGSETTKEKDQAVKDFIEGDARIFMISLRSGAGLDGLQRVCDTVVFGELDWSPHVMDQVLARVDRDGQTKHVQGYYLTIPDGADPFMIQVLGTKRSQHDGLVEGKQADGVLLDSGTSKNRVREMAAAYLKSIGEEVPEPIPETGLLGELTAMVRNFKIPINTEEEMQDAMFKLLNENVKNAKVEREYKVTSRSRLDFLVSNDTERIAIECKIDNTQRAEVYRQVRRYVEEGKISSLLLVAPWYGIPSFKVDGTPVIVIDTNVNSI
jgi:SNF2 family DNA or RNA helicase